MLAAARRRPRPTRRPCARGRWAASPPSGPAGRPGEAAGRQRRTQRGGGGESAPAPGPSWRARRARRPSARRPASSQPTRGEPARPPPCRRRRRARPLALPRRGGRARRLHAAEAAQGEGAPRTVQGPSFARRVQLSLSGARGAGPALHVRVRACGWALADCLDVAAVFSGEPQQSFFLAAEAVAPPDKKPRLFFSAWSDGELAPSPAPSDAPYAYRPRVHYGRAAPAFAAERLPLRFEAGALERAAGAAGLEAPALVALVLLAAGVEGWLAEPLPFPGPRGLPSFTLSFAAAARAVAASAQAGGGGAGRSTSDSAPRREA
eukprot:tig00020961_g16713.t1